MSNITFYGYKKCSTCRKAENVLKTLKQAYNFIDITENPPDVNALQSIAEQAGIELKKLFNTSGIQYRELKIKEKLPGLNQQAVLELLSGNGRLVKRPIVMDGRKATVGFKEDDFTATWSTS